MKGKGKSPGFSTLQSWSSYWATRTPTTLLVTILTTGGLRLDWLNPGAGYDGTSIERSADGVTYAEIDTVASGTLTYTDLTAVGALYYYRVRCYKGTNYSPYSNVDSETAISEGEIIIYNDGNTVVWYDVMDLTTITKDGANRVSAWADKLGSGNNLVQANGANQPLWSAGQITGDGVDEWMKDAFDWVNPVTLYAVIAQRSWTVLDRLFDGAHNSNNTHAIHQSPVSSQLRVRVTTGTTDAYTSFGLNTWVVMTSMVANGAQSIKNNKNAAVTDTDATALNPAGLVLFSKGDAADQYCNASVAEIICRSGNDSDADRDDIIDYLMDKYGIV